MAREEGGGPGEGRVVRERTARERGTTPLKATETRRLAAGIEVLRSPRGLTWWRRGRHGSSPPRRQGGEQKWHLIDGSKRLASRMKSRGDSHCFVLY